MHVTGRLLGGGLLLFLLCASFAHAQAQTLFNFGTMQEGNSFVAAPGENVTLGIYFFMDEQYGNRITHVIANVDQSPPGWVVSLDPPIGKTLVNVSGILVNSSENLYVTPRPVLPGIPNVPEQGYYYLKSPSGKGYLQAKKLSVLVMVPKDAELGKTSQVKVSAEGFWFGQTGNVALRQSRAFAYSITVANKNYSEHIFTAEELAEKDRKAEEPAAPPQDMNQILVYVLGAAVVLLVIYNIAVTMKKK